MSKVRALASLTIAAVASLLVDVTAQRAAAPTPTVEDPRVREAALAQSRNSGRLLMGGGGRWLLLGPVVFDATNGRISRQLGGPVGLNVVAIAANPLSDLIAVARADGSLAAIDVTSGEEVWHTAPRWPERTVMNGDTEAALEFTADGQRL